VSVGVGGAVAQALDDRALRIVPLTDLDAARLVDESPARRLIEAATPSGDPRRLEDLVLRVSALGDALPELALARLNPVIVTDTSIWVTGAEVHVRPWEPGPDPRLRRMEP
jgi:hypothetical protein